MYNANSKLIIIPKEIPIIYKNCLVTLWILVCGKGLFYEWLFFMQLGDKMIFTMQRCEDISARFSVHT